MFTLAALRACVFVLIRFCQIQCLFWEIILIFHTHGLKQPPPQALRFSHGRGERETIVSFPPSFKRTFSSKERRLGTRQGLKHDSTHTEDGNFQLNQMQIIFLEYRARKAAWVNRGEAVITFLTHSDFQVKEIILIIKEESL